MSDYEATRQRHLADAIAQMSVHAERLSWSAAQLRDFRTARLRVLLDAARRLSPWHGARLSGVAIESIDEDGLRALPTMTKADLMAHFDAIVTDRRVTLAAAEAHVSRLTSDAYFLGDLHVVASGGSSGVRGVFVWGWDAWAEVYLVNSRRQIHDAITSGRHDPPVVMVVAANNASHFTSANPQTFRSDLPAVHRFPVTSPLRELVDGLNRVNGTHLVAYASMLAALAAEARAGRLRIAPQRVVSTAEPLQPAVRAAVTDVWPDARIANMWGTSEGGILALGCYQGDGMHLNEDVAIVEPVDDRGEPVPPGEPAAMVYLTVLANPTQPLIRYEITDQVTMLTDPCPCGSAHRRIGDIQGRLDDVFRYADGVSVHPHIFRSVLGREPRIREYQVWQTATGAALRLCAAADAPIAAVARQLEEELTRVGVRGARVTATIVDGLERTVAGKLKRFVPLAS